MSADKEPWEDELVEGLVKAGQDNFSAADSEEAMENIAEPIAKAIKHGGSSGQQQSDWNETDPSKVTFIKNKPNLPSDIPSRQEMAAAIGVETTRATAEEASLQTQINGKASQSALEAETSAREAADTQLQSNIDAETARAQNAESALDTRLTTAESDIDILESSVDALYNTEVQGTDGETSVSSSTIGKVKTFVVGLASAIKTKIEAAYSHISDAVKHITATERTNWNTAYTHSQTEGNPHGTEIEEIDGLRTELTTIESDVAAIEGVIPSEATTTNQLADKAFVNSSITTNTATFRGTSAKNLTEAQFLAWANSLTKTKNDYCFWDTTDSDGNVVFKRYKWNDVQWEYEYTLNNSSFTAAQWAAIQSGITAGDVADIGYNTTERHSHSNKNLLDTYTQSDASLADAVAKKHEHANEDVLENTTASYTSEEKTKLAGIASGAEVNVNADWNATSGDARILNKPSTFPPSSHTHSIGDITGTLQVERGGTGATTPEGADYNINAKVRTALGAIDGNSRIVCAQTSPSTSNGNLAGFRTFNQVWDWIKSNISSVLGLTYTNYGGKAAAAGTADKATDSDKLGGQLPSYYAAKSEIPPGVNVVQTTGTSTANVMSQKAVTDAITAEAQSRSEADNNLGQGITDLGQRLASELSDVYTNLSRSISEGLNDEAQARITSINDEAQTRYETDQSLGTAIQNLGAVKANADGTNANGTWGNYSEGIDSHYTEHGTHTYLKLGTITGNYNIYAGLVFVVNIRQNNARNDTGILTIRKYEYGNGAGFGDTANTSNFVVLDARSPTVTPRAEFYTVSNVSGNTATIDLYVDCNCVLGISLLTCPIGVTWTPNQQMVSSIPSGAETVPSYRTPLTNRTAAVGNSTTPAYVNSNGEVIACSNVRASSIWRFNQYFDNAIYGLKLGETSNSSSTGFCNATLLIKVCRRGAGNTGVFVAQIEARGQSANNFSIKAIGGSDSFDTPVYLARSASTTTAPYKATWYLIFSNNGSSAQSYMSFEIAVLGVESGFTEGFAALTSKPSIDNYAFARTAIINTPSKYINTTFTGLNQYNIVNGNFTIPLASMQDGVMYNFLVRGCKSTSPVVTWNNNTSNAVTFYATNVTTTGSLQAGSSTATVISTYTFKVNNHEISRCVKIGNTVYLDMGY